MSAHDSWPTTIPRDPTATLDIVVVDDDPSTRRAMEVAVRSLGHTCRAVRDGHEAWSLLERHPADVVISDWEMPGLTGPELCQRIRSASKDGHYTYFVLLTGFADRDHLLAGMAAGADDFQRKPLDLDELEARLISAARVVDLHRRLLKQTQGLRRDSKTFFKASRTDALTKVGNRLRMNEELEAARRQALRYQRRYTLAICDIDEFKRFNDVFGHVAGDRALERVAEALGRQLRATDSVYRYGGEEFVVLLPEQTRGDGLQVLERLRRGVEEVGIPTPGGHPLTISAGVAELDPGVDATTVQWIARADGALYQAKAKGRNRVEGAVDDRQTCADEPGAGRQFAGLLGMKTSTTTTKSKSSSKQRSASPKPVLIADVMTPQPFTIGREQTLATAHRMMRDNGIRHLPVLEHGAIVGVLSQRDLYFLETIKGVDIEEDIVTDAMTQESYCVPPDSRLGEVAATMAERRLGCAVVMERDRVIGIFTATDALRLLGS